MVQQQKFVGLLIIYLALQHWLQNPNTPFQYRDISHQMTWYILAHMPYFRRPGHKYFIDTTTRSLYSKVHSLLQLCMQLFTMQKFQKTAKALKRLRNILKRQSHQAVCHSKLL